MRDNKHIKIAFIVVGILILILLLMRRKVTPIIVKSDIKTPMTYNIPSTDMFNYIPKNLVYPTFDTKDSNCGCTSTPLTAQKSDGSKLDLSQYVNNMSGYFS